MKIKQSLSLKVLKKVFMDQYTSHSKAEITYYMDQLKIMRLSHLLQFHVFEY